MQGPDDEFADIEFACPRCAAVMDRFHQRCPACGQELGEDFSKLLRYQVNLRLRTVRRLAPERNGKYKLVDSCSYKRFDGVTTNE